ncbi:ABC transporter ATP-binding protein [Nesterenkonia flava]|uniref:ABC transporter ATP-binding protein n=1 Tax=Nesterenkonia flava TaxID=469799 RepID=A0ABU1FPK7_9MICC|nr:ABC transporter ATP-binding protein [Nesterenkonia flava]MDR5710571.1 ABC transporter ATP-binding protein [Nesterenkonia flava]
MTASTHTEPLVKVTDLAVNLPTGRRSSVDAVTQVSLEIHPGEKVGIIGESGSGKSVTGRAVAGLLPTSPRVKIQGSILVDGEEMVGAPAEAWRQVRTHKVGMIFQDPLTYLNPVMRVGRQVEESIAPRRWKNRDPQVRTQALEFLELAGFPDPPSVARRYPHELSGGMRQRVLIAIAIAKCPRLLIADEPTTALDATVQKRVLETLHNTVEETGTSLILISHDIGVVASMTERIYVMYRGRVVESGTTHQILTAPEHPYTQALLRSVRSLSEPDVELYSIPLELRRQLAMEEAV